MISLIVHAEPKILPDIENKRYFTESLRFRYMIRNLKKQ
jgi:hypothetical protein